MPITCKICECEFSNNLGGQLTNHIEEFHGLSTKDYTVQIELNGIAPICACGLCDESPEFYRGKFKTYAKGHRNFSKREEMFIEKFGSPKCKACDTCVEFRRGVPKLYCSYSCLGSQNGFSKPTTQEHIRKRVKEKYGVSSVFLLPEVREKITHSYKTRSIYKPSEETKQKQSIASRKRWQDPEFKVKTSLAIQAGTSTLEERQRRSEFARNQFNNIDYIEKFFSSGWCRLSKLHVRIRNHLSLDKWGFTSEKIIPPYIVDELNEEKKLIIEINGDYIHANPKKYKSDDIIRIRGDSYSSQEKWEKDKRRLDYLRSKGYEVLVIWESDDMEDWKKKIENLVQIGIV